MYKTACSDNRIEKAATHGRIQTEEQILEEDQHKIWKRKILERTSRGILSPDRVFRELFNEAITIALVQLGSQGSILQERPENVREFASKYFSDPELVNKVEEQVTELNNRLKRTNKP
ncbi:RIIa domain-containing protein 1 [Desmophyllum pertusum]|uniref:RIIa domain-containing protein 1 n=1 Tax=Desmophyllum pertusum TaxID=174260 RepID=A0A9W9Z0L3_9CNID|nr:RIIa domain-containing protein 1 [Desmophyllum pertusum]